MKIVIYAVITVEAEKREGLLKLMKDLNPSVLKQKGCLIYDWAADCSIPTHINVFEEWEDETSLAAHFVGDNFANIGKTMRNYGILGAKARKFRIEQEAPVFNASGVASSEF